MRKFLFAIFFFSSPFLFAQDMKLDTNSILIGQQTKLSISCSFQKGENLLWPTFDDSITTGIEIIERTKVDSTETENPITISQQFTITSFDSGSYYIAPIVFNENLKTDGLILNVQTVELAEDVEIKDIKPPINAPTNAVIFISTESFKSSFISKLNTPTANIPPITIIAFKPSA